MPSLLGDTRPARSARLLLALATVALTFGASTGCGGESADEAGTATTSAAAPTSPAEQSTTGSTAPTSADTVAPGSSTDLTVDLEPGEYVFYCSVGNHRAMGMEVTVTVT